MCIFLMVKQLRYKTGDIDQVPVIQIYVRSTPHPVTVTTRIIPFLVGNPYKPSFATVTGSALTRGADGPP